MTNTNQGQLSKNTDQDYRILNKNIMHKLYKETISNVSSHKEVGALPQWKAGSPRISDV